MEDRNENSDNKPELPIETFNPKGHPSLVYIDGQLFKTQEGDVVKAEWALGPEKFHKDLFIEYERTFGRGLAKAITHGIELPMSSSIKQNLNKLQKEYAKLASNITRISFSGTEQEVRDEIQKIREYRAKYPDLYTDVMENPTKLSGIKFTKT